MRFEVEDQMWSARERTIIARTKQYLEGSYSMKVEVGELGPGDIDVDFRRILEEAQETKKGAQYLKLSAEMVRVNSW